MLVRNRNYMLKRLTMLKNHRCSLQYHERKMETLYVVSGKMRVYIGEKEDALKETILHPSDVATIRPKMIHRMEGIEETLYL